MTDSISNDEWDSRNPASVEVPAVDHDNAAEGEDASVDPIDGADLFDRLLTFLKRFVSLPSDEAGIAVVLWAAHTHLMDQWDSTPRLGFLSAEPGSGKSRAMEISALFAPLAIEAANATTAALVRALDDPAGCPTYFIDEIDTKFGPYAKGDEPLRCMINAGHRRGGAFLRCDPAGDGWVPVLKDGFAAICMAGLGDLPDTILTRTVIIKMRKRATDEKVEPYRQRDHRHLGHALRDELACWADQVRPAAGMLRPVLPLGIEDRDADVFEPLIVVGDLAGGHWPYRAREAALHLLAAKKAGSEPSRGVQLLNAIRDCFGDREKISTKELIKGLLADDEAPWGDLSGKKIDDRKLAKLLKPFEISSTGLRLPEGTVRGYKREQFWDAWRRHLPRLEGSVTSATSVTDDQDPQGDQASDVAD